MKLSAYHKAQGHQVCFWNPLFYFDVVYKSRVFTDTYSKDNITVRNAGQVIKGGTGYGHGPDLPDEIEHSYPDYSLYPQYSETAYGFLSRGCPRGCGFCIVGGKEGRRSRKVADLSEFWHGQPEIKLMDANLLACPDHESLLWQLAKSRALVDFSQGLDIRLITRDNVELLNRVRTKAVHFAWDNPGEDLTRYFRQFLEWTSISLFSEDYCIIYSRVKAASNSDISTVAYKDSTLSISSRLSSIISLYFSVSSFKCRLLALLYRYTQFIPLCPKRWAIAASSK